MKRAIITMGLGFGDEGKGATTDHLCRSLGAKLVVRYSGGSQCGHNVYHEGRRHTFSQFGAGTFAGAETYLGPQVIVYPEAMLDEADHLTKLGVPDVLGKLTVHPACLITTKYHRAANRLRELARGDERHGSCGHGIGEARRYWLNYGRDAVLAIDLVNPEVLRAKLELMRQRFLIDLQPLLDDLHIGHPDVKKESGVFGLRVGGIADDLGGCFSRIVVDSDLPTDVNNRPFETVVFEGAQGVLLDEYHGFHPHTTWSTVTMRHAEEIIHNRSVGEVIRMGVTRPYLTRHGAGPLPSEDEVLTKIVNDQGNPYNDWQQGFRAGWLDLELLRHASAAVGALDCLAVNCLDHLYNVARIKMALSYGVPLQCHAGRLSRSEVNCGMLRRARPEMVETNLPQILEKLGEVAPVAVASHGPLHTDRRISAQFDALFHRT